MRTVLFWLIVAGIAYGVYRYIDEEELDSTEAVELDGDNYIDEDGNYVIVLSSDDNYETCSDDTAQIIDYDLSDPIEYDGEEYVEEEIHQFWEPDEPAVQTAQSNTNQVVSRYKQNETSYGYEIVNEYSTGVKIIEVYSKCDNCFGFGYCPVCKGYGSIVSAGYGTTYPCYMCNPRGKCAICHGQKFVLSDSRLYAANGQRIYVSSGVRSSSSSGSSSSGSSVSKSSCSKCGGSGIDPNPEYGASRPNWQIRYHAAGDKCPICNRYDEHFHDRCSSCNVPNY